MSADFQMPTAAELGCFGSPVRPEPAQDPVTRSDEDLIVTLLREAESYRAAFLQAQHALHDAVVERDRLRQQHHRLLDEYRRLRESMLRSEVA